MNVYMSFWTQGFRADQLNINFWKLSLALAKKHYKKIHLITDTKGAELLKDLPFESVALYLNDLKGINSGKVWSLGKIYAYYKIAKNGPFLHLDSDVLLWERLPEELLSSEVFAQSLDFDLYENYSHQKFNRQYDLNFLKVMGLGFIPEPWQDLINSKKNISIYNVGIFGGQNTKFIYEYADFAMNMIQNEKYKTLFESDYDHSLYGDAILANSCCLEQLNLSLFNDKFYNLKINTLLKDMEDSDNRSFKRYTHLLRTKSNKLVQESIALRVAQEPYFLDINPNITINEWRGENLKNSN